MELDDDIKSLFIRIVGDEGADAKGHAAFVLITVIDFLGLIEIQRIGEEKRLSLWVNAIGTVMGEDLIGPDEWIAGVMTDAGVVIDHRAIEIPEEQVGGQGIGQGCAVIAPIFVIPVTHRVMVGVGERDGIDALIHLDIFMGIGADRSEVILHRQIDVGSADAVLGLMCEDLHHMILPFPG